MAQLTLRTLLAYIDDTLSPGLTRELGAKVADSEVAQELIERIKKVTRRRGLQSPVATRDEDDVSDPNTVAEYLSDTLDPEQVTRLEETCLESDVHLAEVAACHQILTLVLTEPVRVPPLARQRMYQLVPPPASVPDRRPSQTLPVGRVAPASRDRAEHDDADAAYLLGLGRYSTGSTVRRGGFLAAIAGLSLFLAVAVFMALPHRSPEPPETSRLMLYASAPQHEPPPTPASVKSAVAIAPPPRLVEPPAVPPPPAKKPDHGEAKLVNSVAEPRPGRVAVGKVEGVNTLVVSRTDDGSWVRLDATGDATVVSTDPVVCLPGYKADIALDSGVKVHLWGNVPDLLPVRLLEVRARFHPPERKSEGKGEDFDADITLLAGRVYLSTIRPVGARIRLRFAGEVWDVTLPDNKSEFLLELTTTFEPGTPFAREGGRPPQVEVQAAVTRGTVHLALPVRHKTFEKIAAPHFLRWENRTRVLSDPQAIDPANGYYDKFLTGLVASDQGKAVQKGLSDMALRVTERTGVKLMLAEFLTASPEPGRIVPTQLAVYGQAAIAYGPGAGDDLKPLIDLLTDEVKGYARLATVNALAAWIAQAPDHTALLEQQLAAKIRRDGEPETICRLLRGIVSPTNPDPAALDRLIEYLNDPSVAVRELAQWNLINFVDPSAARTPGMALDVALTGRPAYERYVKAWKARIEEIKNRPPMKK